MGTMNTLCSVKYGIYGPDRCGSISSSEVISLHGSAHSTCISLKDYISWIKLKNRLNTSCQPKGCLFATNS